MTVDETITRSGASSSNGSLHTLPEIASPEHCRKADPKMRTQDQVLLSERDHINARIKDITEQITALNENFGSLQSPPESYLKKYAELNLMLSDYEDRLLVLQEHYLTSFDGSDSFFPADASISSSNPQTIPPSTPAEVKSFTSVSTSTTPEKSEAERARELVSQSVASTGSQHVEKVIQVDFPDNQKSIIKVGKGRTVRKTLERKLALRQLIAENCKVFKFHPVFKHRINIPWNADIWDVTKNAKTIFIEKISSCDFEQKTSFTTHENGFSIEDYLDLSRGSGLDNGMERSSTTPNSLNEIGAVNTQLSRGVRSTRDDSCLSPVSPGLFPSSPQYADYPLLSELIAAYGLENSNGESSPPANNGHTYTVARAAYNSSHRQSSFEIPASEIKVGKVIGSGSFGIVHYGQYYGPVAIKRLPATSPTPEQLEAFKNEVRVLKKTRHQNVLLFIGCVSKAKDSAGRRHLTILTQWCDGSSLYRKIHVEEHRYEMRAVIDILRQIAQGMGYLHAKSIIHRDLKSQNIFLSDEDSNVKIGDFGLATVKTGWSGSHQMSRQITGSVLWMAPEVIRMDKADSMPFSNKSDVYSFGIVIYEMLCCKLPYDGLSRDAILYRVGRGFLRPKLEDVLYAISKTVEALFNACTEYGRDDRPEFCDISVQLEKELQRIPVIIRRHSALALLESERGLSMSVDYLSCSSPTTPADFHAVQSKSAFIFPSVN